jgi:mannose-6-phosphate isomerase-like protein (cupin superfamily)
METRFTFADALENLPQVTEGRRTAEIARHGSMILKLYAPIGHDPQTPHEQDELYIIERGSGVFRRGAERVPFKPGDVLFAEAGVEHRFEEFDADFATWVVFWGPKGGEDR